MKTVYELNRNELNELKESYFCNDEFGDDVQKTYDTPDQIPDDVIFSHYDGISFVNDDFFCNMEE